jgi:hypothetical protein
MAAYRERDLAKLGSQLLTLEMAAIASPGTST